jgi:hypothetical protein
LQNPEAYLDGGMMLLFEIPLEGESSKIIAMINLKEQLTCVARSLTFASHFSPLSSLV